jgi:hypothetical protein
MLMDRFANIDMFINEKDTNVTNFERIFSLYGTDGVSDPEKSSIYNLETLNMLINATLLVPDIIETP